MAVAPHSTPTLAHAQPPPGHGEQQNTVDNGPIGIVFAHTSTPTSQGAGFTFNMHKITEVIPGTAAARCGLKADDTLIRLNDRLVDSMSESDLRFYFGQLWGTRSMNIEVLRTRPSAENSDTTQTELERLVLTRVVNRDSADETAHNVTSPLRLPAHNDGEDATNAQGGSYAPHSSPQIEADVSPLQQNRVRPKMDVKPLDMPQSHRSDMPSAVQNDRTDGNYGNASERYDEGRPLALGGRVPSIDLPDPIIQEFRVGVRRSPVAACRKDVRLA